MRNYLNNLYNATCCTLVSDDFSEDTVDQYSFWGLNPSDELTVAGGKLFVPSGGRLRRNNCIDRVKGIRITVSTANLDSEHSLSIFFWCSNDLSAGYEIRIHSNTGAGGEASRRGCLVELCTAGGSPIKSRFSGANSSTNIVEAWADAEGDAAYITVNNSFSWKIGYASAVSEDGYFGIGKPGGSGELEVESYTAVLVGSTDETMGCIGECSHVTPINDCTHTAACNGGTLDENYWTTSDITPNVGGWFVSDGATVPGPITESPSSLWSASGVSMTMSKPVTSSCGGDTIRWTDPGYAERFVTVSSCTNTVTIKINMTKNANLSLYATMSLTPVCGGGGFTASLAETWGAAGEWELGDCVSDESDEVELTHSNVPVGIYKVTCGVADSVAGMEEVGAITSHPSCLVEFTVEGANEYTKLCEE